jgi:hypothetical protein
MFSHAAGDPSGRGSPSSLCSTGNGSWVLFVVAYNMGEWREIGTVLRLSKTDIAVWITTFALTVLADLTLAVGGGMALALRRQRPVWIGLDCRATRSVGQFCGFGRQIVQDPVGEHFSGGETFCHGAYTFRGSVYPRKRR